MTHIHKHGENLYCSIQKTNQMERTDSVLFGDTLVFLKMGESRRLFVYFRLFTLHNSNINS